MIPPANVRIIFEITREKHKYLFCFLSGKSLHFELFPLFLWLVRNKFVLLQRRLC